MRLDRFLDTVCLFKTRSAAARAIDAARVRVDGALAKRSHLVAAGEIIAIDGPERMRTVEVIEVPQARVDKKDVGLYLRVLRDEPPDLV